jgi:hypothetical protein
MGVGNGITRMNAFIASITIKDGVINDFEEESYKKNLESELRRHEQQLIGHYIERSETLNQSLSTEKDRYAEALNLAILPKEREIIEAGLNDINFRLAINKYKKNLQKFTQTLDNTGNIKISDTGNINSFFSDQLCQREIINALERIPSTYDKEKENIKNSLSEMAKKFMAVAENVLFSPISDPNNFYKIYTEMANEIYHNKSLNMSDDDLKIIQYDKLKSFIHRLKSALTNNTIEIAIADKIYSEANTYLATLREKMPDSKDQLNKFEKKLHKCKALIDSQRESINTYEFTKPKQ